MKYKIKGNNLKKDFLMEVFENRGISMGEIENFLKTKDSDIQNPLDLDNMREGAILLNKHIENRSNISIIVDCDVDGLTAAATIYNFIRAQDIYARLNFVMHEGKSHGLSKDLYDSVDGYDLIIIPDASSNDYEEHERLHKMGVDILILDHHDAEKYSEFAIVINNQLSKNYLNKSLSGAGVVWQFIRYYSNIYCDYRINVDNYLDLVALGNVADVMDLRSIETKHLVTKGLNNVHNELFKEACQVQNYSMKNTVTPVSVAWYIAPLLNAMVRVGTQKEKKTLFESMLLDYKDTFVDSTKRGHAAGELEKIQSQAVRLCANARSRQNKLVEEGMAYINKEIKEKELTDNKLLLITIPEDKISPVLIGLVANKIASQYQQPTLILRETEDGLCGSGRNFGNSPIEEFKSSLKRSNLVELAEGK